MANIITYHFDPTIDADLLPTFNSGFTYSKSDTTNSDGTKKRTITSSSYPTSINFSNKTGLTKVDSISTSMNLTNLSFNYCSNLTSVNIPNVNMTNCDYSSGMFQSCKKLTTANISGMNLSNANQVSNMFGYCEKLQSANITNCKFCTNYNGYTRLDYFFENCYELTTITGLNTLDVSNINDLYRFFRNCRKLTTVEGIRNWNVSKCERFYGMFDQCYLLTEIPIDNWYAPKCTDIGYLCNECRSLKKISLRGFNLSDVTGAGNTFFGCYSLKKIDMGGHNMSIEFGSNFLRPSWETKTELQIESIDISGEITTEFGVYAGFDWVDYEDYGVWSPYLKEIIMLNSNAYTANELIRAFEITRTNNPILYLSPNEKSSVDVAAANAKGWTVKFVDVKLGSNHISSMIGSERIEKIYLGNNIVYEGNQYPFYPITYTKDGVTTSNTATTIKRSNTYTTTLSWASGLSLVVSPTLVKIDGISQNIVPEYLSLGTTSATLTVPNVTSKLDFEFVAKKESTITFNFTSLVNEPHPKYGYDQYYIYCDRAASAASTNFEAKVANNIYKVIAEFIYTPGTDGYGTSLNVQFLDSTGASLGRSNYVSSISRVEPRKVYDFTSSLKNTVLTNFYGIKRVKSKIDGNWTGTQLKVILHVYYLN